jgi:hypothetical protein
MYSSIAEVQVQAQEYLILEYILYIYILLQDFKKIFIGGDLSSNPEKDSFLK